MTDFLIRPNSATPRTCATLAAVYTGNPHLYQNNHAYDFWNGRVMGLREVMSVDPVAASMMHNAVSHAIDEIADFYHPTQDLYPDTINLVGWRKGQSMPLHADNANADGSPHPFPWRAFGGLLYLNDDYDGGELHLAAQGVSLHEPAGTLVSLPCGLSHQHEVLEVTEGLRIVLTFFLTHDKSRVPAEYAEFMR